MSGYHWTNLPQISSCHYISWISRDETNGIQLGVYVCVYCTCVLSPLSTHLSFSLGTETELIESMSGASQQGMRLR